MLIRPPRTTALPALSPRPPQMRRRHRPSAGILTLLVAVVALACSVCGATPLGQGGASAGAQRVSAWAASAGSIECGGGAAPGQEAPACAGPPDGQPTTTETSPPGGWSSELDVQPAPLAPWPPTDAFMAVPGHPSFRAGSPDGYYWWTYGQCTWWAQQQRRGVGPLPARDLRRMGDAWSWALGARRRGYPVSATPRRGATVVFSPRVQGAGRGGHVAHVEAVYPGGWFLVSEMNFYANGGGWARVDYRYAHIGGGVAFIL